MAIIGSKKSEERRRVLSLSGGKDSAALAVYLHDKIPNLEYVFMDTGYELPETYEFLKRMRALLGIKIKMLKPKRDFDFWLKIFNGCLPAANNRWCTRELKIKPYEEYIGNSSIISYIGLRADEDRLGYVSSKQDIVPMYPFIEDGLCRNDIVQLLEDKELGMPSYYEWRSRSGCYFCFFQRRNEWIGLHDNHPELFKKACNYEDKHSDGRTYTWVEGISLRELVKNRDKIDPPPSKTNSFHQNKLSTIFKVDGFISKGESLLNDSILKENIRDQECLFCTK